MYVEFQLSAQHKTSTPSMVFLTIIATFIGDWDQRWDDYPLEFSYRLFKTNEVSTEGWE